MAGKQLTGDGMAANLAGMSKKQLYDIMSQMKSLIDQNQHQARQILIQNPLLTKALFQAQIMLGMVKPPQPVPSPSIQPQAPQQPSQRIQQTNANVVHSAPSQVGMQENVSQTPIPIRKQPQSQPTPMSSGPMQGFHSQSIPSQPIEQPRGHMNPQASQLPHPRASQVPNMPSLPLHSGSQPPSVHQPPMPPLPGHMQPPMQTGGVTHHTLQPPMLPQARPPMQVQYQPQMGSNMNFPNVGIPQMPHSQQPMFHPSSRPGGMGPSFHQGQPPVPSQPPHQPLYQMGGSHVGTDFNNQGGNTAQMPMERGSAWPPVSRDNSSGTQLPLGPGQGQMPLGNQPPPPRPPPLAPEVEQALLQQVMSLTQEQINLLPPDQRQQVLQLQQMLRQ